MSLMSSIDHDDLEKAVRRGQVLLDKLEYTDAESVFRDVLRRLDPKRPSPVGDVLTPDTPHGDGSRVSSLSVSWQELARQKADRVAVAAVAGLGETFARQSKMASSIGGNDGVTDWLRLMVHALSLHRDAAALARRAERRYRGRLSSEDTEYFKDAEAMSLSRSRMLEDALVTTVKNQVLTRTGVSTTLRGRHLSSHGIINTDNDFNNNNDCNVWLKNVLSRCSESSTGTDNEETSPDTTDSISSSSSSLSLSLGGTDLHTLTNASPKCPQQPTSPDRKCRRRINFDRIQAAIRRLVDEASTDVRSQYGHLLMNGATQTLMQRRVASELMLRLARTSRDGDDMETTLENAIMYEEEWDEEKDKMRQDSNELNRTEDDVSESGSESDYGTDDYETVYLECQADMDLTHTTTTASPTGHSRSTKQTYLNDYEHISENERTTVSHFLSHDLRMEKSTSGQSSIDLARNENGDALSGMLESSEPANVRVSNAMTVIGLNNYATVDKDSFRGIITVWKSYDNGAGGNDVTQLEQHQEKISSTAERRTTLNKLPSFEEVSPLTERERVFRWLDSVDLATSPALNSASPSNGFQGDNTFLTSSKLSQTVGFVSLGVAESLRNEAHFREACDVYKYALGIFQDHPPSDGVEGSSPYSQLVAGLLRDIGIVKCNMGDMAAGCQLMEESATLYEWKPSSSSSVGDDEKTAAILKSRRATKVAEVWYQLGNMFLSDELRGESLLDYIMLVVQMSLGGKNGRPPKEVTHSSSERTPDDLSSVVSSDEDDTYSVCTNEAINCYQRVIEILDRSRSSSSEDFTRSELNANTLSRLADCYLLTNQFHRAIECYERSLPHFRSAAVGLTPERRREMALLNAHVLGQLGTVNFMLRNYLRASSVYEMSAMLRQHLVDASVDSDTEPSSPTLMTSAAARSTVCLEAAWTRSMYGLTLSALGRHHQCVVWSLRAFAEYIRVLRGQIISVRPPVRRWFVVETLFTLGQSYGMVDNGHENAVHYLTLAKNLIRAAPDEDMDVQQTFKVLMALSEALEDIGDSDEANKYQTEAVDLAASIDVDLLDDLDQPPEDSSVTPDSSSAKKDVRNTTFSDVVDSTDVIPESVIRDGVASIIDQFDDGTRTFPGGTKHVGSDMIDTVKSIEEAERVLHETLRKTGGSAAILRVPAAAGTDRIRSHVTTGSNQLPEPRNSPAVAVQRVGIQLQSPISTSSSSPANRPTDGEHSLQARPSSELHVTCADTTRSVALSSDVIPTSRSVETDKQPVKTVSLDVRLEAACNGKSHFDRPVESTRTLPEKHHGITRTTSSGAVRTTLSTTDSGHSGQQWRTQANSQSTSSKSVAAHVPSMTHESTREIESRLIEQSRPDETSNEEWTTFEEVIDTPAAILSAIRR